MKLYKLVFFHSYQINKRLKKKVSNPILDSIPFLLLGIIFNFFTLFFLLEIFFGKHLDVFWIADAKYRYIFGLLFVLLVISYFVYKKRYQKIIDEYTHKYGKYSLTFNVLFVLLYYVFSFTALLLVGMQRNGDLF